MAEHKLSLDDTVNDFSKEKTKQSDNLFGGLDFQPGNFDEPNSLVNDDLLNSEIPAEQVLQPKEDTSGFDELADDDFDFEPPESTTQESDVVQQPVQETADDWKSVFSKQEQQSGDDEKKSENLLHYKKSGVEQVSENVVSHADVQQSVQQSSEQSSVSSLFEEIPDDLLGEVPENIVKPVKVIDVVRKARNGQNKASNVKKGIGMGSGKKKSSKGDSEVFEGVRMCHVKGIPRILMDSIMLDFHEETPKSQTDALVAWIVCHCEEDKILRIAPYLTDYQVGLIESWENTPNAAIQNKLDVLLKRMQNLAISIDTLKLMEAYATFDRMGFRKEGSRNPRYLNMMESGVVDVVVRAEEQTTQMRNDRSLQKGRPKK